jgi:hypothetical protein
VFAKQSLAHERDCFGPNGGPRNDTPVNVYLLPTSYWALNNAD